MVGVPTETVYGLAGNAFDGSVIRKIFEAKGRPSDNPLIVHISNMRMLESVVSVVSEDTRTLASAFWPGPLTLVLPKSDKVCKETTAGLESVGVRMPDNDIARNIIEESGVPFAAPSANVSGKPSPTNAIDVFEDMNGRIPLIIDGGECVAGVESTVLSLLGEKPIILRPGVVTKEDIEEVLHKEVLVAKEVVSGVTDNQKVLSPGMKYKHYSPKAEVYLVKSDFQKFVDYVNSRGRDNVFAMCFDGEEESLHVKSISYGSIDDPYAQAHNLFAVLRQFDSLGAEVVYVRCPKEVGVHLAVYNRLIRAAGFKIIEL